MVLLTCRTWKAEPSDSERKTNRGRLVANYEESCTALKSRLVNRLIMQPTDDSTRWQVNLQQLPNHAMLATAVESKLLNAIKARKRKKDCSTWRSCHFHVHLNHSLRKNSKTKETRKKASPGSDHCALRFLIPRHNFSLSWNRKQKVS